jgi:sialic acid synthase SpsE
LELPFDAFRKLAEYCRKKQIIFMSTPFDLDSADFLADLGLGVIKIPSGEITNLPFLHHIAKKNIPLIVSTGMSNIGEIDVAVRTIKQAGNTDYVLLHCVSNYPADPQNINLRSMKTMESAFHVPIGYSDHTLGNEVALAAVAMGACIIEKHFTLDCSLPGPDQQASLEPGELKNMVESIRIVEAALGNGVKEPAESEVNTAEVARRSLVAACDISAGTVVEENMISILRPGTGLPPSMYSHLIGRTARNDVEGGILLTFDMFS